MKLIGDPSTLYDHAGQFKITYMLRDLKNREQSFSFYLKVPCVNIQVPDRKTPSRPYIPVKNPPKPYIKTIDAFGNIVVGFTEKILPPTFKLYPEFLQKSFMKSAPKLNSTNSTNTTNQYSR